MSTVLAENAVNKHVESRACGVDVGDIPVQLLNVEEEEKEKSGGRDV